MGDGGRPPFEITEEVMEKAENYAEQGMTKNQIAQLHKTMDCLPKYVVF